MSATVFLVAGELGGCNRWDLEEGFPRRALMTDTGVREVLAQGIEIGSHGWAHRDLRVCSGSELDEELVRSRDELQQRFGVRIETFAYPYGRHAARHFQPVAQAGYRAAVSIFSNAPTVTHNPFMMRRIYVHAGDTPGRFRFKLSPLYLRYVAWRDRNYIA
jgi:peptidoglycan/xylan/chitin deacetylase (PgdA/CDA1 family)